MLRRPTFIRILLPGGLILLSLACASSDPRSKVGLSDTHRQYTAAVRWSKFEEAANFVQLEDRAEFLARMPDFDLVRFTDWKAGSWDASLADEENAVVIVVTYRGFRMVNPIEFKAEERQFWKRDPSGGPWWVKSEFSGLDP